VFEMSNFVLTKQHLREVLIFCFNWKKSTAEAHQMLEVYGDTVRVYFAEFIVPFYRG